VSQQPSRICSPYSGSSGLLSATGATPREPRERRSNELELLLDDVDTELERAGTLVDRGLE
jgi:hypothetical protein